MEKKEELLQKEVRERERKRERELTTEDEIERTKDGESLLDIGVCMVGRWSLSLLAASSCCGDHFPLSISVAAN